MEIRTEIALLVLACGLVTLLPRVLPLVLLRGKAFPRWLQEWLSFIPVTVMAALVAQELTPVGGDWAAKSDELLATLVCAAVALVFRNLFLTVVAGVAAIAAFRLL